FRERGKPDLLVYRKTAEAMASITDEAGLYRRLEQKRALDAFVERWFGSPESAFKAAFHVFKTLDELELLLRAHLSKLIRQRLPQHITREGVAPSILWHQGSPYRGLERFDAEHAPIFFGRTRAIGEIKHALMQQAANGCAFLLILGMSGCGKS